MPENSPDWLYDDRDAFSEPVQQREKDPNRGALLPLKKTDEGVEFAWPQFMLDMYNALSLPRDVLMKSYEPTQEDITEFALGTGAVGGGVSAALAPDADLGMFLGAKAANADLNKFSQALRMNKTGADREEIWKTTGWWQKPDGNWAFEIDDSQMDFGLAAKNQWKDNDRLRAFDEPVGNGWDVAEPGPPPNTAVNWWEDAVDHPALKENYGDDTDMPLEARMTTLTKDGDYGGVYNFGDKGIKAAAGDEDSLKGVLLHELQHAVQQTEGWEGKGSNPQWTEAMIGHVAKSVTPEMNDEEVEAVLRAFGDRFGEDPFSVYSSEEGEMIARLTQKRRNLTEKQRKAIPPWEDFETPRTPYSGDDIKEEMAWTQKDFDDFMKKYFTDQAKENPEATLEDFNEQWKRFTSGR